MEIKGIINKIFVSENKVTNKLEPKKENLRGDVVEISKEAKELFQKNKEIQFQQIRERISNNFYNSDEVLNKVAEKILKEIKG
jgi:negative regulator of flagellin synthesis FlgM